MENSDNDLEQMHQDPDNWKWGIIYFNPRDRRIFVLKRNPAFGITFNFASPYTGLILFGALVTALLLAIIPTLVSAPH